MYYVDGLQAQCQDSTYNDDLDTSEVMEVVEQCAAVDGDTLAGLVVHIAESEEPVADAIVAGSLSAEDKVLK